MAVEVIMPKMGESIVEGTIVEWKKSIGDHINKDETLLEISTDKVDTEIPSPAEGTVLKILYKEKTTVAVGEIIAIVGDVNENIDTEDSKKNNSAIDKSVENDSQKSASSVNKAKAKRISMKFYSPVVRALSKKHNISISRLDSISGSGKNGRVNKSDILNYIGASNEVDTTLDYPSMIENGPFLEDRVEEMDNVRKKISEHMTSSIKTSAHVYSTSEADITNLLMVKDKIVPIYQHKYNVRITVTSLLIDCCIKALKEFPLLNCSIDNDRIIHHKNINIGVAVALENNNLIVPVIKKIEEKNLLGISRSLLDISDKAKKNILNIDDITGSTFTVTNPGVFGGLFGLPIINQPNVAILSTGKIQKRPIVKETNEGDMITIRSMIYLTLGYDHRLIDGAYGTKYLTTLSNVIENYNGDNIGI